MNNNYSRRKFIKTAVVSAGAVGATGLAGCGGDSRNVADGTVEITSVDTVGTRFPQSVASGDPRPSSIILWTRVSAGIGEATVTVQVATDENFSNIVVSADLSATISNDHCIKVKITDLARYTRYYYRFVHEGVSSRTGRFRTAPATGSDVNVKFGFVSCQDYTNGYYNSLLKFLESENDDIDFIVHLGDYIYETTGDSFQGAVRNVSFSDSTGAIDTGESEAAATTSQYRDLYKTYRSDQAIQRVHERFPFICIWDDHEFSDDAWQNNGTYFNAMADEESTERKQNAEKAFFEFMPLDIDPTTGNLLSDGQVTVDQDDLYQSNIYRGFRYGRNLNLIMTDYRTFRNDHLIPEDAFPGTVVMTNLATAQTLYSIPGDSFGFKATVDDLLGGEVADIKNPTAGEQGAMIGVLNAAVAAEQLPLLPYVDIDNVTETTLADFLLALNSTLTALDQTPFSESGTPTLKKLLVYALEAAYQTPGSVTATLTETEAEAKAAANIDGNLDALSINGTLDSFYNGLLSQLNNSSEFLENALTAAFVAGGQDAGTAAALASGVADAISYPYTSGELEATITAVLVGAGTDPGVAAATAAAVVAGVGLPYADYDAMFTALSDFLVAQNAGNPVLQAIFGNLDTDESGSAKFLPPSEAAGLDEDWGFEGYGISYALLGKQSLSSSFGSRYLVVKPIYDLLNLYEGLVLETDGFGNAWGSSQQTSVFLNLNTSTAAWNVLGSSVSFTSLILDASDGEILDTALDNLGVSDDDFPRTSYLMNVDHWDGFPLTRATYMNDASGLLGANGLGTLQDTNTVIISGDIHAAFVTDHGANPEGTGRCIEFTTTAVSSGTFGSFTADSVASVLGLESDNPGILGLTDNLGTFLQAGAPENTTAPQTLNFADPNANGVSIMELTSTRLTCNMYLLDTTSSDGDPTLLSTSQYTGLTTDEDFTDAADAFADSFTTITRTSTKQGNGQNGELVEP